MRINYNADAYRANSVLQKHERNLSKSMQRLSSGMKISVADEPAHYAIAGKLNVYIEGNKTAKGASVDGVSVIHVADGVLNEMTSMVQRLNELAIQASNEILSTNDRQILDDEAKSLMDEIQRMADTTQFNGQNLLDGTFDNKAYAKVDGKYNSDFKVLDISDTFAAGNYTIRNNKVYNEDGSIYLEGMATLNKDNVLTISGSNGRSISVTTDGTDKEIAIEYPKIGPMTLQIGANEGENMDIRIPQVSLSHIGLKGLDLVNAPDEAIDRVKNALTAVTSIRSRLGSYENRLEHVQNNLDTSVESLTASYSKIMDTDIAEEMVELSTHQILQEATMNVLTQINQMPEKVLQLLS